MTKTMRCPACKNPIDVEDSDPGDVVQCANEECGKRLRVPAPKGKREDSEDEETGGSMMGWLITGAALLVMAGVVVGAAYFLGWIDLSNPSVNPFAAESNPKISVVNGVATAEYLPDLTDVQVEDGEKLALIFLLTPEDGVALDEEIVTAGGTFTFSMRGGALHGVSFGHLYRQRGRIGYSYQIYDDDRGLFARGEPLRVRLESFDQTPINWHWLGDRPQVSAAVYVYRAEAKNDRFVRFVTPIAKTTMTNPRDR